MSKYDYYNKNKKEKLFSWSYFGKMVAVIFACFIGVFGLTIFVMWLAGSFDEKHIPPDGIKIELENQELEKINGKDYLIPKIEVNEDGVSTFSITVKDAMLSLEEGKDPSTRPSVNELALSVDVDNERVIKLLSKECKIGEPIVFEIVKNSDGFFNGGFAGITVRSFDGVYGTDNINVFVDVPVDKVENNLKSPNTAQESIDDIVYNILSVGDILQVFKPKYTPTRSSNPTILANGTALKADKKYIYKIEYQRKLPNGDTIWEDIDSTGTSEVNKIVKWKESAKKDALVAVKTGIFRTSCMTYSTYKEQENDDGSVVQVQSDYTYFKINEVNYESIQSEVTRHIFEYVLQGVSSEADLKPFRIYLNSAKSAQELSSLNAINLGLNITLPSGYNQDKNALLNALKDVYLTYENEVEVSKYYKVVGEKNVDNGNLYPIKDITTEYNEFTEYYYEVYLISKQIGELAFKFNIKNTEKNSTLTHIVNFSMKENHSSISFIPTQDGQTYGKYDSLVVKPSVDELGKDIMLMDVSVDTSLDGDNAHYVDLNKLVKNTPEETGKVPSYWLVRYFVYLGRTQEEAYNQLMIVQNGIMGLDDDIFEIKTDEVYGVEILDGIFSPKAYESYKIYAVLMQTDINGEPVIYPVTGTYTYKSCEMNVNVKVQVNSVQTTILDDKFSDLYVNELKENYSYYLHIQALINGGVVSDEVLANYVKDMFVTAIDTNTGTVQNIPVSIGDITYLNTEGNEGYYAKIDVTTMSAESSRNIKFVVNYQASSTKVEEFGATDSYIVKETAVRGVEITSPSIDNIVLKASWEAGKVIWSYTVGDNEVKLVNGNELILTVFVNGENKLYTVTSSNSTSVKVLPYGSDYKLVIGSVIDGNSQVTIRAESIENPNFYDELVISFEVPKLEFGLGATFANENGIYVDNASGEIKKQDGSGIYNHVVYKGQEIDLLSYNDEDRITATLNIPNDCKDLLQFSFEVVTDYATIEGSKITFTRNPATSQTITVLIQGFASTLKYVFRLDNNIKISYKDVPSMFNTSINENGQSIQNRVVMTLYNGVYYPTIVYTSRTSNQNTINLNDIIDVSCLGGEADLSKMVYKIISGMDIVSISQTGSEAKLMTIGGRYVAKPTIISIQVYEEGGQGSSITFSFLAVPDIMLNSQVLQSTHKLKLTADNKIMDGGNDGFEIGKTDATVFIAESYVVSNAGEHIYGLNSAGDINVNLLLKNDGNSTTTFYLRDFAGIAIMSEQEDFASFINGISSSHGIRNIEFSWKKYADTSNVSYVGLTINNNILQISTASLLTNKYLPIYIRLIFIEGVYIEVQANITINPYYSIEFNLDNPAVKQAVDWANQNKYASVTEGKNAIVMYNTQTLQFKDMLKVKNDDTYSYINSFNYNLQENPNNMIKLQNATVPTSAQVLAQVFNELKYAKVGVSYKGVATGFEIIIIVIDNVDVEKGLEENNIEGVVNKGSVDAKDATKVKSNVVFSLNDMYKLYNLSSGTNISLQFSVGNAEAVRYVSINNGTISFKDTAEDILVQIDISTNLKYLDDEGNVQELKWTRYFMLQKTQQVTVTYPFENNATIFTEIYPDNEKYVNNNPDNYKTGVNGYIRVKANDVLKLSEMISAIDTNTNQDIWNRLLFTVQEYDIVTQNWKNSSLYSVTGRDFNIPSTFNKETYTRIHITSTGGVDAYVNALLSTQDNAMPNLSMGYPSDKTHISTGDGKQYEYRDKAFAGTDEISLMSYDSNVKVTRLSIGNESLTRERLYLSCKITGMNSMQEITVPGITAIIENGKLKVTKDENYTGVDFVVRVYVRTDYGFYMEHNDYRTYNIYYGNNISILPTSEMQDGVHMELQLNEEDTSKNIIDLGSLFDVIVVDGTPINVTIDNYGIKAEGGTFIYNAYVDAQGKVLLDLNNNKTEIPVEGIKIIITLTLQGVSCDFVLKVLPSSATIKNADESINSAENPASLACDDAGNITKTNSISTFSLDGTTKNSTDSITVTKEDVTYKGLDDVVLSYEWLQETGFTITPDNELDPTSWTITTNIKVYEPTLKTLYLVLKNGETIVRKVAFYVMIYPTYKIEVQENANVQVSGDVRFAEAYSGAIYNTNHNSSPLQFNFFKTSSGNNYASTLENAFVFSFDLLDINGNFVRELYLENGVVYFDNTKAKIFGEIKGNVFHSYISAEDYILRINVKVSGSNSTKLGYSFQQIIVKFDANLTPSNVIVKSENNQTNTPTNPIMLKGSGVDILNYITFNLFSSSSLSDVYLQNGAFVSKNLFDFFTHTSNTVQSEDILLLNEVDNKWILTKNTKYVTSENVVQEMTLYLFGVKMAVIYVSIPRDFAYTFDSTFTTMYASDSLDLKNLANSFVGESGSELHGGTISYSVIARSVGEVSGVSIANDILTISDNKDKSQEIVLLAKYTLEDKVYTAKTVINVLPEYTLTSNQDIYYMEKDALDADFVKENFTFTYGGQSLNLANYNIEIIKSGKDLSIESGVAFANYATINVKDKTANNVLASTSVFVVFNENNVEYKEKIIQDNLTAGTGFTLQSYIGEFFIGEEKLNFTSFETYSISLDKANPELILCEGNILKTEKSYEEVMQYVVVKAELNVNGEVAPYYGIISIRLYPTVNLNAMYTYNAQQVSVFKAYQSYNLNSYIIPTSNSTSTNEDVVSGKTDYTFHLYDLNGNPVTGNMNDYFTAERKVSIAGQEKYVLFDNSKWYVSDNKTIDENDKEITDYNGENRLWFDGQYYDIIYNIAFDISALGYSMLIDAKYSFKGDTENHISTYYFLKVDNMDLNITPTSEKQVLSEGDTLNWKNFISDSDGTIQSLISSGKITSVTYEAIGSYYDINEDNTIINTCNLYSANVSVIISFLFANGSTFLYAADFELSSVLQVSAIKNSVTNEYITEYTFSSTNIDNILDYINYQVPTNNVFKDFALLDSLTVSIGSGTSTNFTFEYKIALNKKNNYTFVTYVDDEPDYNTSVENDHYKMTISGNKGKGISSISISTTNSVVVGTFFNLTYSFKGGNQEKNVQIKTTKVTTTDNFSAEIINGDAYLKKGEQLNLLTDISYNNGSINAESEKDNFTFYVADDTLFSIDEDYNLIANVDSIDDIKSYLFINYHNTFAGTYHTATIAITLQKTIDLGNVQSSNKKGFPTLSDDEIKAVYNGLTGYNLIVKSGSGDTQTESKRGGKDFGTLFNKYASYDSDKNEITLKQNYTTSVFLQVYQEFIVTSSGQKFVLANNFSSSSTTAPTLTCDQSLTNENGIYVLALSAGESATFSVTGATSISTAYHSEYNGATLTFNGAKVTVKSGVQNVDIPIVVTATSKTGDVYHFLVYVYVAPTISYGQANVDNIAGVLQAGGNFASGYDYWIKANEETLVKEEASTVDKNAKFYIGVKLQGTSGNVDVDFDLYSVAHSYDIVIGGVIGEKDTLQFYNNVSISETIKLYIDGEETSDYSDYTFDLPNNNLPSNNGTIEISGNILTITPNQKATGTYNFTITATKDGVTYEKPYTITFQDAYAVENITHTINMEYNNGVIYEGFYTLLDLNNFSYTTAGGVKYTYDSSRSNEFLNNDNTKTVSLDTKNNSVKTNQYPTATWTYTNGYITGISYTQQVFNVTIPVVNTESGVTNTIKVEVTVSRKGMSVTDTNDKNKYIYTKEANTGNSLTMEWTPEIESDMLSGKKVKSIEFNGITYNMSDYKNNNADIDFSLKLEGTYNSNIESSKIEHSGDYLAVNGTYKITYNGITLTFQTSLQIVLKVKVTQTGDYIIVPILYESETKTVYQDKTEDTICEKVAESETLSHEDKNDYNHIEVFIPSGKDTETYLKEMFDVDTLKNTGSGYVVTKEVDAKTITYYITVKNVTIRPSSNKPTSGSEIALVNENGDWAIKEQYVGVSYSYNSESGFTINAISYSKDKEREDLSVTNDSFAGNITNPYTIVNSVEYEDKYSENVENKQIDNGTQIGYKNVYGNYILHKGYILVYANQQVNLVFTREEKKPVSANLGLTISNDYPGLITINSDNTTLSISGTANENFPYGIKLGKNDIYVIMQNIANTKFEHVLPTQEIAIFSNESRILNFNELGEFYIVNSDGSKTQIVEYRQLEFASGNDSVLKVVGQNLEAGFVLEDTSVTLQITISTGVGVSYVAYLDALIKSSIQIETEKLVDVPLGNTVDLNALYTITQDGQEIDLSDLSENASVSFSIEGDDTFTGDLLDVAYIMSNAGKLLRVNITFTVGEIQVEKAVMLSIANELYELNEIEDVFTLYAGQTVDLEYINLKLQDALGYSLGKGYISSIAYESGDSKSNAYVIDSQNKTITAKNVFADVSTSVVIYYTLGEGESAITYTCPIDLYLLPSFTLKDTLGKDLKNIVYSSLVVNTPLTIGDIQKNFHIKDRFNNDVDLSLFGFEFSKENGYTSIVNADGGEIQPTYTEYTMKDITVYLDVYHMQNGEKDYKVASIPVVIQRVDKDRTLVKLTSDIIYANATSISLETIFENYVNYINANGDRVTTVRREWFDVIINYAGVALDEQSGLDASIVNNNTVSGIQNTDLVEVTIKDKDTKEEVTISILLQRQP